MARVNYYGGNWTPHLWMDSIDLGSNTGIWASRINSELAVSSPLEIVIGGQYNPTTRTGQASIRIVATAPIINTNLKVRMAIIESNIYRSSPNGTTIHNQTFRDIVPNTNGIPLTIAEGDTVNLSQSFACPSPLVPANCELVVFVQSDTGHRILQGAKRDVMDLYYVLDPFSLILPANYDTIATCTTSCFWHMCTDSDSGYAVRYQAFLSFTSSFASPFLVSDTLSDTMWTPPICLPNDSTYFWKVVAFNGHAPNRESQSVFRFTVKEPPTCSYVTGDVNGSGSFNGLDASYTVSYLKGGPPPPYSCDCPPYGNWYVAGDVNGSCNFNGLDVSYMVAFFKGGPPPECCASCPSSR